METTGQDTRESFYPKHANYIDRVVIHPLISGAAVPCIPALNVVLIFEDPSPNTHSLSVVPNFIHI